MKNIHYRWMEEGELSRLADIDRGERIHTGYEVRDGKLQALSGDWDVPGFLREGNGENSLAHQIKFCLGHLLAGGKMIGAFAGGKLAGIGILTPDVRPKMAQLAYLHVSRAYRRKGIATHLTQEMIAYARQHGAHRVYVSATPSESAVGFYTSQGFRLCPEPLPELFELEPEDIHMILEL
jgi:ribosomal protein S18 acetylase RimI-like enzyme